MRPGEDVEAEGLAHLAFPLYALPPMREGVVRFTVAGSEVPVTVEGASRLADQLRRCVMSSIAHSAALKIEAAIEDEEGGVAFDPEEEGSLFVAVERWVHADPEDAPPDILGFP